MITITREVFEKHRDAVLLEEKHHPELNHWGVYTIGGGSTGEPQTRWVKQEDGSYAIAEGFQVAA